jgi:hypothetical protein
VGATGPTGPAGSLDGPAGGALSGTYPNPSLAPNAVSSSNIVDGTIVGADIKPGAIGSTEIADQSVGAADLSPFSVTGQTLGAVIRVVETGAVAINKARTVKATCPEGSRMLSGGARWEVENVDGLTISYDGPDRDPNALRTWVARGANGSTANQLFEVVALCLA